MNVADIVGSFGVGMLLLAYVLTILKVLETDSRTFIWMNVVGGTCACIASVMIHYVPFIVLEGAWALVSIVTLIRNYLKNTF